MGLVLQQQFGERTFLVSGGSLGFTHPRFQAGTRALLQPSGCPVGDQSGCFGQGITGSFQPIPRAPHPGEQRSMRQVVCRPDNLFEHVGRARRGPLAQVLQLIRQAARLFLVPHGSGAEPPQLFLGGLERGLRSLAYFVRPRPALDRDSLDRCPDPVAHGYQSPQRVALRLQHIALAQRTCDARGSATQSLLRPRRVLAGHHLRRVLQLS